MFLSLFQQNLATSGGGYDDDDKPRRKKRKPFVFELDGQILKFDSRAQALDALNSRSAKPAAAPRSAKPGAALDVETSAVIAKAAQAVSIADIEASAKERNALAVFQQQLEQMQYQAMLQSYEQWQDDQDVEDLLMLAFEPWPREVARLLRPLIAAPFQQPIAQATL